ncbi:syntaxin [Russula ochroleuca]|jgi:regulator of vacuolar morphogenesis|uniref:Syntaxin n=1 Tax=Russula ochroleuca TaxID=152965 RepID=A0A9P5MXQ4_9AGAM|nr:syntaxin [Russula ochroleuca]
MAATAIQAVYVRGHEERIDPKPHVVFRIDIQAHVRSWQMWRRYSEFTDLHTELTKSVGAPPPSPLPPKHAFAMLRSPKNEALLEERRAGLEAYLRAIISTKDSRWLDTYAFRDFLGIPIGKHAAGDLASISISDPSPQFTSSTWLDEHMDLQARVRDIRADVNRRDAFSERGDVGGAHTTNVQAKKKLAGVLTRVGVLVKGLDALVKLGGMSEGELQRRTDMAARLQDDCEKLAKMLTVSASRLTSTSSSAARNATAESDRAALLGGGGGSGGEPAVSSKPIARVFGVPPPPKETEETRPLDDHGVFQLQQTKMDQQDAQLGQLTAILQRQKQLGTAINNELAQHIELLDGLSDDMDRVGGKLTAAKKQLNRLG